MSLKRKIAELKIRRRKAQYKRDESRVRGLALKRNKALKEAAIETKKAAALESERKAELAKMDAQSRVKLEKSKKAEMRRKKMKEQARAIASPLIKIVKPVGKKKGGKSLGKRLLSKKHGFGYGK